MNKKKSSKKPNAGARRLNVSNNIKIYTDGNFVTTKNSVQLVKEKVIDDTDSEWYNCEILYYVNTQKRGPVSLTQQRSDRFLFLLRKKDNQQVFLVQIVCKGIIVDVKSSWDFKMLRAIDLGDEDCELILSFETADYSWHVSSQLERDETVWILAQVAKVMCQQELSLGYSVDMDLLGYATKANGTLLKFPLLKPLSEVSNTAGDIFAEEEAEAEILLEELHWASEAPAELLQTLSKQSDTLNMEIIDFLLQWEEEDSGNRKGQNATKIDPTLLRGFHLTRDDSEVLDALSRVDAELEGVDEWIGEQISRLAETQKKLSLIETESGTLETSYHNLQSVELIVDSLEKALSISTQEEKLLLHPNAVLDRTLEPPTLKNTASLLLPLLNATTKLQNALSLKGGAVPGITPLVWKQIQAMAAVSSQRAKLVDMSETFCKAVGDNLPGFLDRLLKHKYINDLTKPHYCINAKHISLLPIVRSGIYLPGMSVEAQFVEHSHTRSGSLKPSGAASGVDSEGAGLQLEKPRPVNYVVPNGTLYCLTGIGVDEDNEAINCQNVFHSTIAPFIPVLERLLSLDSTYSKSLCRYYTIQPAQEKMYNPLFKALFKDIKSVITSTPILNMSSLPSYRSGKKYLPTIRFLPSSSSGVFGSPRTPKSANVTASSGNGELQLTSWMALAVILIAITPIFQKEEEFFLNMFPLDSVGMGVNCVTAAVAVDKEALNRGEIYLDDATFDAIRLGKMSEAERSLAVIFDGCQAEKIFSVLSNVTNSSSTIAAAAASSTGSKHANEIDGIEAVAMLVVLQQFLVDQLGISFDDFEPLVGIDFLSEERLEPYMGYVIRVLIDLRSILLKRISLYSSEQIKWVNAQKGDAKKSSVSSTVKKFPALFMQIAEIVGNRRLQSVDQMLSKLSAVMVDWILALASQNDKYSDIVRIHNFGYLERCVANSGLDSLKKFGELVGAENAQAEARYVNWMIEYEFPALSSLSQRMGAVGGRVRDDEFGLYVRRKDVVNVVKELEKHRLEESVSTLRKRLDRHFSPAVDDEGEVCVASELWDRITNHMVGIVRQLEIAAATSYQITLENGPASVQQTFTKHRTDGLVKKSSNLSTLRGKI